MPFPFRLTAVDMDDTLLGPEKAVSSANRAAVERLRETGSRVVLASGRRHENMVRYYDDLGLDDFAVSCQGARVEHVRTGEVLHLATVASAAANEVIAAGMSLGLAVVVWKAGGIFAPASSAWVEAYGTQTGGEPVIVDRDAVFADDAAEKIVWVGEETLIARENADAGARFGRGVAITEAHGWCLEFSHPNATKGDGLAAIARSSGIPREAVLAFGDGYNDVSMFRWAGLGVAMSHGRDVALQSAHRISSAGDPGEAFSRAVDDVMRFVESGA